MSWDAILNSESNGNGGSSEKVKYTSFPEGTIKVRILDEQPYSRWRHWIPQANGGKGTSVDCIGKGCPVCAAISADKVAKRVPKMSGSKSHAINVLNRTTGDVEILDKGNTVFTSMATIMQQMGDLRGYDITITRKGKGTDSTYTVLPVFPPTPLTEAEKGLTKYNIQELYKPFTVDQINQIMTGKSIADVTKDTTAEPVQATGTTGMPNVDFSQSV